MAKAEDERMARELREVRIALEGVNGMMRFLLATQLIRDGLAKDLREASRIARDREKVAALYPLEDD